MEEVIGGACLLQRRVDGKESEANGSMVRVDGKIGGGVKDSTEMRRVALVQCRGLDVKSPDPTTVTLPLWRFQGTSEESGVAGTIDPDELVQELGRPLIPLLADPT